MKTLTFKKRLVLLLLAFLSLWALRIGYGYLNKPNGKIQLNQEDVSSFIEDFTIERKNYASSKMKGMAVSGQAPLAAVDQKYEKVGTLTSLSQNYEQEEKALYDLIKQEQIMIQFEQRAGLKPARQLNIALGVIPDKFDATIEALRKIGELKSIQIDKNDKTNEYKKLDAERISLQKARDSLIELREKGGNTGELLTLTSQLLDLEKQIQALGVSLGDFDANNEFCTVKFSLKERRADKLLFISFVQRAKVAFLWAVGAYMLFGLALLLGLSVILLGVYLLEKWQRFTSTKTNTAPTT